MLEKTEGEIIKNGQSRDTGNIGHKRHRTKASKNKTQHKHRKLKRWATRNPTKTGGEPRWSRKVSSSCFW